MADQKRSGSAYYWVGIGLIGVVLVVGCLFALLQTAVVKGKLSSGLSDALSSGSHRQVKLGRLEGVIPLSLRMDSVEVSDEQGAWLVVKDIVFRWSPFDLLKGRIRINEISASSVELLRKPQEAPEEETRKGFEMPSLPESLPSVSIDKLAVPEIRIGQAVAGQSALLEINGSVMGSESGQGLLTFLRIDRIDEGPKTQLEAKITLQGSPTTANVQLDFREPEGGWVSAVSGVEASGPLSLVLYGDGPLSAWKGTLEGNAGKYGSIHADIDLSSGKELKLNLGGNYYLGSFLPAGWMPLVGHSTVFGLSLNYVPSKSVKFERMDVHGGGYSIGLKGGMDLASGSVATDFNLDIGDLGVLETVAGSSLEGKLNARGRLTGPLDALGGSLSLEVQNLRTNGIQAQIVSNELELKALRPLNQGLAGLHLVCGGSVSGLASLNRKPFPETALKWSISAVIPAEGKVTLENFRIKGDYQELDAAGSFNTAELGGQLDAVLKVSDIKPFADYLGEDFRGTARMEVRLSGDQRTKTASGSIRGSVVPAEKPPARLAPLFGPSLTITGDAQLENGDQLSISAFKLESAAVQFESHGSANLSSRVLKSEWRLSVPKLGLLASVAGRNLGGKLDARGDVTGPLSALETTAVAEGDSLAFEDTTIDKAVVRFNAKDIPTAPKGNVEMELRTHDSRTAASSNFIHEGQLLKLSNLNIQAQGNGVQGNVEADLKRRLIAGSLDGKLKDLSEIGRLLGKKTNGSAEFHIGFSHDKRGQDINLKAMARGLDMPFGKTKSVKCSASLSDVLEHPAGNIDLEVLGFERPDIRLNALTLQGTGSEKGINFRGMLDGRSVAKFDLNVQGVASHLASGDELRLESLHGNMGEFPLKLLQPASLKRSANRLALDGLVLNLGSGNVQASGRIDEKSATMDVGLNNLPLGISALFMKGPALSGSATGRLQMSGAASAPTVQVDLQLEKVRSSDQSIKDIPPLSLVSRGSIAGGMLNTEANIEGLTQKPAHADVRIPVRFSVQPFIFSVPNDAAIEAHLNAEGDLATVTRFVHLEGQKVAGLAAVNMGVHGRISVPQLAGEITVHNGSYENFESGTVLKGLEIEVLANGDRLEIKNARASDGGRGKIIATGSLELNQAAANPVGVNIKLTNATLVRRDDATGTVDGDVSVQGSLKELSLKGNLTVVSAQIDLPKRLPPEVRELDVIEINSGKGTPPVQEKSEAASPLELILGLNINLPNRVFVRGWGLDSVWSGNLSIKGTSSKPAVIGSLTPVRGTFDFVNRRFNIVEGSIGFFGSIPPSPYIDITAEAQVKELTARLHIRGSGTDTKVILESDPPLPQDEILAQIMFGRGTTSITPTQALRLASTLDAISGLAGGSLNFVERTRKLLQLDVLEYREAEGGSFGKGTVGVGKYLMENVYMEVEKGVGQKADKASVEVDVTRNISVESEVGSDAKGGIGVSWKYEY